MPASPSISSSRKFLVAQVWLLALVAALFGGCSGINASRGISPATFLLPGIMGGNIPQPPAADGSVSLPPQAFVAD